MTKGGAARLRPFLCPVSLPFMGRDRPRSDQGGGPLSRSPRQSIRNCIHDLARLAHHRTSPEAHHLKAFPPQHRIAHGVVPCRLVLGVLAAIDLNHQPPAETDEVQIVAAEGRLPSKVKALGAQALQPAP